MSLSSVDLSNYVLVGRYDLPEPTRTAAPANSLLAQEVSAVTYNWDTGTLFVVGDGGTSIVQVSLTGQLINSMTLAPGSSPQGTEFYDTEGLTYVGDGKFVMTEERDRQAVEFTYAANTTLTRSDTHTVDLGTFVQNIGLEGVTYDPLTGGFIFVKETLPEGIFQTGIDFAAGTATNGSPTTENSVNLFDPAKANLLDFADVFALSNLTSLNGQTDSSHLLVLSQESGKIVEVDRAGNIYSSLTITSNPGNPLSVAAQQHEGLTMDSNGNLYVVSENGGGDFDHPQVWVYAPSSLPNTAPTAIALSNQVNTLAENTSTATRLKVADVVLTDDGLGNNKLTLTGADAGFFEVDSTGLYVKAGTVLDFETKTSYAVTVVVDDPAVGGTPDATTTFSLSLTDVAVETPTVPKLIISEVAPWSSGNSPFAADWFEVTNTGSTAVNITGWKMDDNSNSFGNAVALNGITSIGAGESVIFIESSNPGVIASFKAAWFDDNAPAGLQIGTYSGSGVGLSTGGDAVNVYNSAGVLQANVTFANSPSGPSFQTFNNAGGLNNTAISQLSSVGINGAVVAASDANEIGSPGSVGKLFVSEVAPWSSGNSPVGADWFEVTNTTAFTVNIAGWKMDDSSGSFAAAVALNGITSIAPGESVIFIESGAPAAAIANFKTVWFGDNAPANLQIGTYTGGGVGLSTGSDAVNLYNSLGVLQTGVSFGPSPAGPSFPTFDNSAANSNVAISQLSTVGANGGFAAINDTNEIASPGTIATINHAPVAGDNSLSSIAEDSGNRTISFASLLANDSKGDVTENNQSLTITSVGNAVGGTVTIVGTDVIFAPTHDYNGPASFDYTVQDNGTTYGVNHFLSDVGSVSFTITPVNDAPVITSTSFGTPENSTSVGIVAATDVEHDAFSFALAGGDDASFFAIDSHTGALRFLNSPDFETPEDANHDGSYAVNVSVTDLFGASSTHAISVEVSNLTEVGQTINGGNKDDALSGSTGDDAMNGGNGNDSVNGGDGNDNLSGANGDDTLVGGRGNDLISGGNGNDKIDGGVGNNQLFGENGNDILVAGNGNNTLSGGNGDDTLRVGSGNNSLSGGNGGDTFVFLPNFGKDVITDFGPGDHIEFDGVFQNFQAVQAASHQVGADTVIYLDPSLDANHAITLVGVTASSLHASDFLLQ